MQSMAEAISNSVKIKNSGGSVDIVPIQKSGECGPGCDICGGVGFIRYNVPFGHYLFGRVEPCPNIAHIRLMEKGNFGLRWDEQRELTWGSVVDLNNSIEIAAAIRNELENQSGAWIFLHGEWGLAKSLILKIAVAESLRSGREAHYINMVDLLDDLRQSFDEDNPSTELKERIAKWSSIPLLAIDEFEKTNPTPWVTERLFQIFDRRYNLAIHGETSTLIASNQSTSDFPPAIASRLSDGRGLVLRLEGDDMRPGMTREDKF